MKKLLLLISFLLLSFISSAHTVQTFWELRDDGTIRFWLEHWHNDVNDSNLGNFYIVVNQGSGNQNISGSGYYNNIPFGNLPVQGTINNRVQCSGQANTYNDWVYYDFLPVKCNEEVTINFVEGPPAETEEACTNGLFGYSITQTFYDRSAPTITAIDLNVGANQTNCAYVAGSFSNVSVADNCDSNPTVVYSVEGNVIDPQTFVFPLGTTTVFVEATDNTGYPSNNSSNTSFDVIVNDSEAPTFTSFPTDIQVNVDAGKCDAVVTYNSPTASDNCDTDPAISLLTGDFASGSAFPLGVTTVTYEVSDGTNKTTQSFTVTVVDNVSPSLSLQDITRKLTSIDGLTVPATEFITAVNDNCSYTITPANFSFDCTNVGTQQVAITVTDGAGNETTKNAQITIENPDALVEPSEGNTLVSSPGNYTVVDNSLLIHLSENINGATVSINENFQSGDELRLDTGLTLPSGVTSSYNASTGVLTLIGAMSSQELQDIFRNIQFRTTSSIVLEREIVFNIGAGVSNSDNNHYYEYVDGAFTWQQAKADAVTKTLNGLQGYLATSTSAAENEFIRTKLSGDGWLGGSDYYSEINSAAGNTLYNTQTEAEGKWYWVTGPEAGTQFSEVASAVNGQYVYWYGSEPNNHSGDEHALQIYFQNGGRWNDEGSGNTMGYIVEYGGLAGDASCFQYSGVKTLELNTPPQISEIADIENCPSEEYTFTVNITDAEDTHQNLEVKVTSSNQAFIPDANINIVHNGTNYEVTIVPVENTQASANITITATDSGNLSSTEVFKFTAVDNVDPEVFTQNITVQLDQNGAASIVPADIDNGSSDNCEIDTMSLDITDFSCSNLGQNTVTLTVKDKSGNETSETATVIVEDKISPQIFKPSQLVFESDSEFCGAYPDILFSTQDNCATTGNIAYNGNAAGGLAGWNLTLNGGNGWAVNGNSFRTSYSLAKKSQVIDLLAQGYSKELLDTAPEISISENYRGVWPDFSDTYFFRVELRDEKGEVIEAFNSGTLTANNTWQTVSSSFNDYGTGLRYIFIEHGGKDVEFWAGHYGTEIGNLNVQVNAPGVTPNLPVQQTAGIPLSDEFPVGETVNSYVVMDYAGNTSTTSFTITVEDKTLPKVVTQNITVQLDAEGNATITPEDIDNGSSDACGISEMSLDIATFDCSNVGENTVVLTVEDNNGNTASSEATVTVEDKVAPVVVTQNITIQLDAEGNATITPAMIDNGSSDACGISEMTLDNAIFDCSNVGENTVVLTVEDNNGNTTSSEAIVTVEDNVAPVVVTQNITVQLDAEGNATITPAMIDNGSSDACGISEMTLDIATFDCSNVGENTVELTVEDNNGNTASSEAVVTVEDNVAPVVVTQNITVQLDASGNATITPELIDNGSSDACEISEMTLNISEFTCENIGDNTVILTVTDIHGNEASAEAVVTVEDNIAPQVITQDITLQLDAEGNATIEGDYIVGPVAGQLEPQNSSDTALTIDCDCPEGYVAVGYEGASGWILDDFRLICKEVLADGTLGTQTAVTCFSGSRTTLGTTNLLTGDNILIGFEVTDGDYAHQSPARTHVSVKGIGKSLQDVVLGAANTSNNIMLNGINGSGTATSNMVTTTRFAPAGNAIVGMKVNQSTGYSSAVSFKYAPLSALIEINNGSTDNCAIASIKASKYDFTCEDIGENTVTLTVADVNGNSSTATAIVTVEDNVPPVAVAVEAITIQLDENGLATIAVEDIDNESSDNCGIDSMTLDIDNFSCENVGTLVTVTLRVTDNSENVSTATTQVTVEDNIAPVVSTKDITVQLDAEGNATITPQMIDNGSADACGISEMSLDIDTFDCSNVGDKTVVLTVEDNNGNTNSSEAIVTVEDKVAPIVETLNITVQLDAEGNATITPQMIDNGSADACGISEMSLEIDTFDCSNVGENTVVLTVEDNNGNTTSSEAIVTVEDNIVPVVVTQNITVQLDAEGNATITPEMIDNGSADACGISEMSLDIDTFDCSNVGDNTVVLTVEDNNGNTTSAGATVTVEDNVAPNVVTQNITVQLDAEGNATITPAMIDNGSADACGISEMSLDIATFDCSNVGENTVVLTVEDNNGNTASSEAVVTVEDKVAPVVLTQNITVQLDASGNATILLK